MWDNKTITDELSFKQKHREDDEKQQLRSRDQAV